MSRMCRKQLLVSDLDRTLLNDQSRISPENLEAIAAYVSAGGAFTVASGRPVRSVLMYQELLPYLTIPFIAYNGAGIYDAKGGRVLYQEAVPRGVYAAVQEQLQRYPEVSLLMMGPYPEVYVIQENALAVDNMRREKVTPVRLSGQRYPDSVFKFVFAGENRLLVEIEENLQKSQLEVHVVLSEENYLELMALGTSKGNALAWLSQTYGIPREQIVAVGDGLNDLTMLRFAGIGVAVENANHRLKPLVSNHCCSNEAHAIREVIERYCL